MFALIFAAVVSHSVTVIPDRFLGRWERKASGCRTSVADKLDQSFLVVELRKISTFEAEDQVKGVRLVSPREVVAHVVLVSEGSETPDQAKLTLLSPDRLSVSLGKGWRPATYVRCAKPTNRK